MPRTSPRPPVDPVAEALGPVPEGNRPGHHPPVEQDKPIGAPPRPPGAEPRMARFRFRFDRTMVMPALAVGVVPATAEVVVGEEDLVIRFGPWSLRTPLSNVVDAAVTGPYSWFKVAGPPHLSLSDSGITFATSTTAGACVRFAAPVPAALPFDLLRHAAATVTVEDPAAFVQEVQAARRRVRS